MLTTTTLKTVVTCTALAAILLSCASSQSEREPRAGTPEQMDAAVAANISSGSADSADSTDSTEAIDTDSGKVVTQKDEENTDMTDSTESANAESETTEGSYEVAVRSDKNHIVLLETNHGDLTIELWRDVAPNHADSFLARVKEGFYDGLIFHRVIPGFMIQGGDPTGTGGGSPDKPGYLLDAEFSNEPHHRGILSMARRGSGGSSDPQGHNTASSQFFICHGEARMLDRQYTVFGNLLSGYETLDAIAATKKGAQDRPVKDCIIKKASVIK